MKLTFQLALCMLFIGTTACFAQRGSRSAPGGAMDVPDNPQAVGESGVAWYTTWETGLQEAKRSNRPILFMAAATTCSGVSGVF